MRWRKHVSHLLHPLVNGEAVIAIYATLPASIHRPHLTNISFTPVRCVRSPMLPASSLRQVTTSSALPSDHHLIIDETRLCDNLPQPPATFYVRRGKRVLDIVLGGSLLVLSLPFQGIIALLVRKRLGRPVFFRQARPGLEGEAFTLVKFRTMTDDRDSEGLLLPDECRLPPFGQMLRSTSLDELPELVNVVRGHMSLVGPRPLLTQYLARYTPRQARRHAVPPGITGLSQISGRNNQAWNTKFDLDLTYIENVSLTLDLQILVKTIAKVLLRSDISAEGHATAPAFGESI